MASLDDLMATKLKVILQRVEAKDYLDVAAMVASGIALDKGLSDARLLYGKSFQPSESLKALVYSYMGLIPRSLLRNIFREVSIFKIPRFAKRSRA